MGKQVLWVIKQKDNDYVFPTLKEARASTVGLDDWVHTSTNIRIIARVVLDRFRKRKQKGSNG